MNLLKNTLTCLYRYMNQYKDLNDCIHESYIIKMDQSEDYKTWCKKVLFIVQSVVLLSMVLAAIVNIFMKTGNLSLWTALLGSSLGYLLQTPRFRVSKATENISGTSVPSLIVT